MTELALSRLHFPVTTLGPGRRIGVWFQGCTIGCRGCISPDTWAHGRGLTTVAAVMDAMSPWIAGAEGLTVSGGEPFEQADALAALLQSWRARSSASVLVFTGFTHEAIRPWIQAHPGLIDAIVCGPFDRAAPQTLALRGSDNQTLHVLTQAGGGFAQYERLVEASDRRLDVMFDDGGGAWFAGIPARDDFRRLTRALKAAGHQVTRSDRGRASA